jgi:hypothetical protein
MRLCLRKRCPRVRELLVVVNPVEEVVGVKEFMLPRARELEPTWLVLRTSSTSDGSFRLYAMYGFLASFEYMVFFKERK